MSKVLIIGLDGGTFDLIKPWVKEGKLPNIARLMHSGVYNNLQSTIPPMTFPAWNAFMTGKNPGKHGVFDFMERKNGTYDLEIKNAHHRKSETIWKIASKAGKRCAVIGVPVTYPPEEINGIMISGFDTPFLDERIMYPRELFNELKEKVGQYIVTAEYEKKLRNGQIKEAVKELFLAIDRKAETAKYLLMREAWDLFMIVFGETDAAIHYFWKYHDKNSPQIIDGENKNIDFDPIYEIYNRVDIHIGKILELSNEETTVILMSDHGAGGAGNKVIYVNRFLELHDLLQFKHFPIKTFINKRFDGLKFYMRSLLPKSLFKHLLYTPKGIGLKWESKQRFSYIDWSNTKVYAEETPYYPNLRVNLKGREPGGIVEKSDYMDVVDQTIAILNEWKDPETGMNVVRKAYFKEELYHGNYIDSAPDIIISWNEDKNYAYLFRPSFTAKNASPIDRMSQKEMKKIANFMLKRSGSHRDEGIFVITGKRINPGANLNKSEIIDIAPTILYLLDISIPVDMDGKVLSDCFKKDYVKVPIFEKVCISKTKPDYHYSDEETDQIKERLKGLGYIE
jgi:predicted AlkP superfamily phosphohydrolase/phosphomutase